MQHPTGNDERDFAGANSGGMDLIQLERWLSDLRNEPNWRPTADKCAQYYDHKQSSAERIERAQRTGEPMATINLIQRTINGALGQEAKSRLNWKADADTAAFSEMATLFNEKLSELQREALSDMAISEAYSSMIRTGIGWVEVSRNPDPLAYPYRVLAVHRNEVWWDWRARQSDKADARWQIRQRWVDLDEAEETMPQFRDIFEFGCNSGPLTDAMAQTILTSNERFASLHETRRQFSLAQEEWLDNSVRKRVRFYDVYYKKPVMAVAMVSGTKRVKFNPRNPLHVAAVQRGLAKLIKGPSYVIRHAMYAGPFRLFDKPLPGRHFPLVPFVCYSDDSDGSPYGLVHGMIEPQDEFNERRSRLMWLLKAKQVFVDDDALNEKFNTIADLAVEVMRPDAMFVLNANRRNAAGVRIEQNANLQSEQVNVMQDAKQLIQDVPGLYSALLGSNSDGVKSGVALNSLVEQSVTSLGETSDNYRTSRTKVGDLCMALIAEDHTTPNMQVQIGSGKKARVVVLNTFNEQGMPINQVEDAPIRMGLGNIPATSAYRNQQQVFLSEAIRSIGNDPVARAILVPALLEQSDIENGAEYAKWMRKQAGVPEPEDMGDDQMAAQQEQAQGQQAAITQELQLRGAAADVAKREADAALTAAKAQREAALTNRDQATAIQSAAQAQQMSQDQAINDSLAEAMGQ